MDLVFNYSKIKKIAKEVKKVYTVRSLVEIVQYIFMDEDIMTLFIREGADLKSNSEADTYIGDAMMGGTDYFEIQQEIVRALIAANFYKKELQEMLNSLTVSTEVEK